MQKNKIMKKIFSLFSSRIALFWLAFLSIASVMMFTNCAAEMEPKKEDKKKDKKDDPVVVAKTNLEYVKTIGTGSNFPYGVDVADGKLYVVDTQNHRVLVYTNLSGTTAEEKTITGGFNRPIGLTIAGDKLYVADENNNRVLVYTNLSGTTAVEKTITGLNKPSKVAVANGKLYVADTFNYRVQIYTNLSGTPAVENTIGAIGAIKTDNTGFNKPYGVTVADGKLYVADYGNHRVQIYTNLSGTPAVEKTIGTGSPVTNNTGFDNPYGVAVDGDKLYVADQNNHRVQVYTNLSGTPAVEKTIGTGSAVSYPDTANTGFNSPYGVAVDGDKLYVADRLNQRIQVYEWKE